MQAQTFTLMRSQSKTDINVYLWQIQSLNITYLSVSLCHTPPHISRCLCATINNTILRC